MRVESSAKPVPTDKLEMELHLSFCGAWNDSNTWEGGLSEKSEIEKVEMEFSLSLSFWCAASTVGIAMEELEWFMPWNDSNTRQE